MGDAEEADYQAALGGEQTELAPSSDETRAQTAWSLDDGPEEPAPFWTASRITVAATSASLLAVIAATGLAGYHLRTPEPAATPVVTPPVAATTTTAATPPPPVTITTVMIQPPPPPTVTKSVSPTYTTTNYAPIYDERFLDALAAKGWPMNPENRTAMVNNARWTCVMYDNGVSWENTDKRVMESTGVDAFSAAEFNAAVRSSYPNCS